MMARFGSRLAVLGLASFALASGAYIKDDTMPALSALCTPDVSNTLNCNSQPDGGAPTSMVGHICPKGSRPDMDPHYNEAVPQGLVCGEQGPPDPRLAGLVLHAEGNDVRVQPRVDLPGVRLQQLAVARQVVTPDHVIPATQGSGTAMTAFNDRSSRVAVTGAFSNLSSTATAAHIHASAGFGENADVVITLTIPANVTSGGITGSEPVTADQMKVLRSGQSYIDVHTVNFPDGEFRGQVQNSFNGFQCRGSDRPEALNPLVDCGNGVREKDFINFCCTSRLIRRRPRPGLRAVRRGVHGQAAGLAARPDERMGCTDGAIPAAEDFKANESRADFFYFLCATPRPAPRPRVQLLLLLGPRADSTRRLVRLRPERAGLRGEPFRLLVLRPRPAGTDLRRDDLRRDADERHQLGRLRVQAVLLRHEGVRFCSRRRRSRAAWGTSWRDACYGDRPEHQWPLVTCPDPPVRASAPRARPPTSTAATRRSRAAAGWVVRA